ncbi:MAG: glycosyltransferase [bacterium]|nr:glycosyltransferase [bacterium]
MRILFVTASYLPVTNGVTYHIASIKKALEESGHKVYILAPSFPGYKDNENGVIRFPSFPNPIVKSYPVGIPIVAISKIKKIKPDIVHTHHPFYIGQYASQIAERLSIPLFFSAHTQYEKYLNYYFPQGYKLTSKLVARDIIKLAKKCNKIICPSQNTKIRVEQMGIKNTTLIHNGVEDSFFNKPNKKSAKQPTLVFTGRLEKEKNPIFLIKIAGELVKTIPNFKLIVIGSGSLFNQFQEKLFNYKLSENVIVTGEVARSLLPDIYKSAHLFITPSMSEVMPLSIIEAAASGLPVIVLKGSGLEDLVINKKTGYILDPNPTTIAEKITCIFSNEKLLTKLSRNSYIHSQNFSVDKTKEKLLDLYNEVVSDKPSQT